MTRRLSPRRLAAGVAIAIACVAHPASAADLDACVAAAEQAQPLVRSGRLVDARAKLVICADATCPGAVRDDCAKWLAELEPRLASVVIRALDPAGSDLIDVRVSVDGRAVASSLDGHPIHIDPGVHTFRFESPGVAPVEQKFVVSEGELRRPVSIRFAASAPSGPAPAPAPVADGRGRIPTITWVLGGAGVAAAGVGAFFWISGRGDRSDLESTCAKSSSCAISDVDAAKTKLLVGDVLVASGLVLGAAAVWFALTAPPAPKASGTTAGVRAFLGPVSGLEGRF